ncbi:MULTISPECIES: type II secretion system F family protein [Pseudomonas]|uniref:type II secretion system F family protein n=1 Tax=Pseudomonas TaxID=286 RepID=UPI00123A867F|nr:MULTISPECIES: type II secretion system F family protein [Pseudomonas]QIB52921.1 type II secretion protein F [Pseudomonas sp. OIL-1]
MQQEILFAGAFICALGAGLLIAVQSWWSHRSTQRRLFRRMTERLSEPSESGTVGETGLDLGVLNTFLQRADISLSKRRLVMLTVALLAALTVVTAYRGVAVLMVVAFLLITAGALWWRTRFQKRRQLILAELPGIIDTVQRNIEAGRSLDRALVIAFEDASPVFRPLVFRLRSTVESGREYTGLFEEFAALYKVPSLILVAIALRTSSRFGSSIRPVLQQVANSLRSQQELRREFLATTSETRFTAVIFALLPPALAGYMVLMNSEYADVLLHTQTGHQLLITAGVLQTLGMLMMWRMIQGVGHG